MAKHMTQDDRKVLEARYNAGQSVAGIARAMSFNYSTIYKELKRGDTGKIPSNANFMRAYGLCNYLDDGGNWHSFEGDRLLRTYVEHRPDRRFIELQSHPLLIPDKVDSWLVAEVC